MMVLMNAIFAYKMAKNLGAAEPGKIIACHVHATSSTAKEICLAFRAVPRRENSLPPFQDFTILGIQIPRRSGQAVGQGLNVWGNDLHLRP